MFCVTQLKGQDHPKLYSTKGLFFCVPSAPGTELPFNVSILHHKESFELLTKKDFFIECTLSLSLSRTKLSPFFVPSAPGTELPFNVSIVPVKNLLNSLQES